MNYNKSSFPQFKAEIYCEAVNNHKMTKSSINRNKSTIPQKKICKYH